MILLYDHLVWSHGMIVPNRGPTEFGMFVCEFDQSGHNRRCLINIIIRSVFRSIRSLSRGVGIERRRLMYQDWTSFTGVLRLSRLLIEWNRKIACIQKYVNQLGNRFSLSEQPRTANWNAFLVHIFWSSISIEINLIWARNQLLVAHDLEMRRMMHNFR